MALRFWLHLPFFYPDFERPYGDLIDETVAFVQAAERLGFEGVVVPENNFHNFIVNPSALELIAYLAPQTTTLKFQTGVLVLPMYHPLRLAGQVAFTDHITRGRLSLGIARGGGPYQADRLGYDGGDMRAMYEESLEVLRRAWTEDDISHEGRFWSFPETTVLPRLYQQEIPKLWVAAQSATGIRNAGRQGLNLMTSSNATTFFTPYEEIEQILGFYDEGVAESGGARGDIMAVRGVFVGETVEDALAQAPALHRHWSHYAAGAPERAPQSVEEMFRPRDDPSSGWKRKNRPIKGGRIQTGTVPPLDLSGAREPHDGRLFVDPEGAISMFSRYESLGVTHLDLTMLFGAPLEDVLHSMELLSRYVMPEFSE
ncbi:LLM class flavin-dependent oxidoreductase [Cnuibacter physcomitrellae]|uniref:LLM class flavin-dependent oxidoreductase n=1 Tax=Cnuibacter physcomitrellae TaxID=1619308 RepID=UPI002175C0E2|nr:LLM class flavin-dependent oxidoreductase [Cnuibacter physcomitrellae]MCS5498297.1 LLM class flavin-dependent oxidoreductase [Cnuibacter physcomitrellae]